MTWHVDRAAAQRYVERGVDAIGSASIEAHVERCAPCRTMVSEAVDPALLAAAWAVVDDRLDQPRVGWLEALLQRLGCSDATARVVAVTSRVRCAYLMAVAVSLALAFLAARSSREEYFELFLVFAPLGPLVATAVAFGRWADPAAELVDTVPMSSMRILLVRTTTTIVPAIALTALSLPWLLDRGLLAIGWLLPSLALALGAVALSTWVRVEVAVAALAALWVGIPVVLRLPLTELVVLFEGPAQLVWSSLAAAAVVVTYGRRTSFTGPEDR